MSKEKLYIERKASDNKYLHRDFFVTGDIGIAYVGVNYGDEAVEEYLTQYAKSYYKHLAESVQKNGLEEIEKYFISVYEKEEWSEYIDTRLIGGQLIVTIEKCPAVTYMKSIRHTPSKWYKQTVYTVYATLAKLCGLSLEVIYYNENDGATEFVFKEK